MNLFYNKSTTTRHSEFISESLRYAKTRLKPIEILKRVQDDVGNHADVKHSHARHSEFISESLRYAKTHLKPIEILKRVQDDVGNHADD